MNLGHKLGALAVAGIAVCAAMAGPVSQDSAEAFGNPRIIVHVAGTQAGTVEFENALSLLPEELFDPDTGDLVMPAEYCGLRVRHVGGIWWHDANNNVVEAENHGEVNGTTFMGQDIQDHLLDGMVFSGPLSTCGDNLSWSFPIPLTYGGTGPPAQAERMVLDLDQGSGSAPNIEFLDGSLATIDLSNIHDDGGNPGPGPGPGPGPDPEPWQVGDEMIWGCVYRDLDTGLCPRDPEPREYPSFTLGCMAYATGCDPDPQPQPIETFAAPESEPVLPNGGAVQMVSPDKSLQVAK